MRRTFPLVLLVGAGCLAPKPIALPEQVGAWSSGLLTVVDDLDQPILPFEPQTGAAKFALLEAPSGTLELLGYSCSLAELDVRTPLLGARAEPATLPQAWLRSDDGGEHWSAFPGTPSELPLLPVRPQRPTECWRFVSGPAHSYEAEGMRTIRAVGRLDEHHLLVGGHSPTLGGPPVPGRSLIVGSDQAELTVSATVAAPDVMAIWGDPDRRRAFALSSSGALTLIEARGTGWSTRTLAPLPGVEPCVYKGQPSDATWDVRPRLAGGVRQDGETELLAVSRCGTIAYYQRSTDAWRVVRSGQVLHEDDAPLRVGAQRVGDDAWWVVGLDGLSAARFVGLHLGVGPQAPERLTQPAQSIPVAVTELNDGRLYVGTRAGELYRVEGGSLVPEVGAGDGIVALTPLDDGLLGGLKQSPAFQFQPGEPDGICTAPEETPELGNLGRLDQVLLLGADAIVGLQVGDQGDSVLVRSSRMPPLAWACHPSL